MARPLLASVPASVATARKWHPNEHQITLDGQTKNLREWCQVKSIHLSTIHRRVADGMSYEEALTKPMLTKSEAGRLAAQKRWGLQA